MHSACSHPLFTKCSFGSNRNKHDYCRGKDCMKNFCKDIREHVMKITNFAKLKMLPLIEKKNRYHYKQKLCCINKFKSDIKIS